MNVLLHKKVLDPDSADLFFNLSKWFIRSEVGKKTEIINESGKFVLTAVSSCPVFDPPDSAYLDFNVDLSEENNGVAPMCVL